MPAGPPQYDPNHFGTTFGAAGGAPPTAGSPAGVPLVADPRPHTMGAPPDRHRASTGSGGGLKSAMVVGALSAILASLLTGAIFVSFVNKDTKTATTSPTTRPSAPAGTIVGPLDIYQLLDRARPSVVAIHTNLQGAPSNSGLGEAGSGVIISPDGLVLTNAHVIEGAGSIKVSIYDGTTKSADLVGSNPDDDIALIKVRDVSDLQPAELGSSDDLKVGDPVVAIGNALNLGADPSVTDGIVSAKHRDIQTSQGTISDLIQTNAAINPGNSGGPLLNARGQVVGINTAIIAGAQNIGFAIAIDAITPILDELKNGNGQITPTTAYLGVQSQSVSDVNQDTLDKYRVSASEGAFVADVVEGSAAETGGLQPGDVITSIDGEPITSASDVGVAIRKKKAGDKVTIEYEHEGKPQSTTVTLGARPN